MPCAMSFDKGIDYITHRNALRWVLIRELIIFLIVMLYMGCDKEIDYISHCNSLIKTHRKELQ